MPKRILQGVVVSDKQDKTVVVSVERQIMHPVYRKFVKRSKKFAAHDENNQFPLWSPSLIPRQKLGLLSLITPKRKGSKK